jgi:hypothetical protein
MTDIIVPNGGSLALSGTVNNDGHIALKSTGVGIGGTTDPVTENSFNKGA